MVNKYKYDSEAWQRKYVLMCEKSDFLTNKLNAKRKKIILLSFYAIVITVSLIIKLIIK